MAAQQPIQDPAAPIDASQNPQQATTATAAADEEPGYAPLVDPRLPTRKDSSLRDFISKIDDYAPIIPEGVTAYYMTRAGLPPPPQTDPRLAKLLALATQKFIADIAADAYQYARIRASNSSAANNPMAAAGYPAPGAAGGAVPPPGAAVGGGVKPGVAGGAAGGVNAPGQQLLGIQRAGYGGGGQGGSQNRTVLGMEDLGMAMGEYGVNVKRSEFYR